MAIVGVFLSPPHWSEPRRKRQVKAADNSIGEIVSIGLIFEVQDQMGRVISSKVDWVF